MASGGQIGPGKGGNCIHISIVFAIKRKTATENGSTAIMWRKLDF
jgi:hypothetical protein